MNDSCPTRCLLCRRNHFIIFCDQFPCRFCYKIGHSYKNCPLKKSSKLKKCSLCGSSKHVSSMCTIVWRMYHSTVKKSDNLTDEDLVKTFTNDQTSRCSCSWCGSSSHFSYECPQGMSTADNGVDVPFIPKTEELLEIAKNLNNRKNNKNLQEKLPKKIEYNNNIKLNEESINKMRLKKQPEMSRESRTNIVNRTLKTDMKSNNEQHFGRKELNFRRSSVKNTMKIGKNQKEVVDSKKTGKKVTRIEVNSINLYNNDSKSKHTTESPGKLKDNRKSFNFKEKTTFSLDYNKDFDEKRHKMFNEDCHQFKINTLNLYTNCVINNNDKVEKNTSGKISKRSDNGNNINKWRVNKKLENEKNGKRRLLSKYKNINNCHDWISKSMKNQ